MKIIIALIATLGLGGVAGWSLHEDSALTDTSNPEEVQVVTAEDVQPLAEDFVSLRPALADLPSQSLSAEEQAGLLYMREEEKLAHDVYLTLYDAWGLQIFSNIAQSELTHTEAVRDLLVKYDLADPVINNDIGTFTNQELQTLYDDLVARGTASLEEALIVGAIIEELDIRDIQTEIGRTDNSDIALVYENLMRGSRNHLRSFMAQLESRGGTYQPQYISQTDFDAIVQSAKETGAGGSHDGRGQGRGRNN